jgi:3-oxoacyl-[acyl-carrier protein] reductase
MTDLKNKMPQLQVERNWESNRDCIGKEGVNVILVSRTQSELDEVATEVNNLGVKSLTLTADVSDIDSITTAVDKALDTFQTIDILINNAGIAAFGKFLELEPKAWERIIQVNLMGTYYTTRAVLPNMIARQTGDIINISSTAGLKGNEPARTVHLNLLF